MSSDRQFERKKIDFKKQLKWIIPVVLAAIAIFLMLIVPQNMNINIIITMFRYLAAGLSVFGVSCIFYAATGIIPDCKKRIRYLITALMIATAVFIYVESKKPKDIVQMEEGVIYKRPKSAIDE